VHLRCAFYDPSYTVAMKECTIILTSLKPIESYIDQIRMDEKHKIECSERKNKKVNVFAKKRNIESALLAKEKLLVLMYKDVYLLTNSILFCLLKLVLYYSDSLVFFLEEVSYGLPPLRGIVHQSDLIVGYLILNRLVYRTNLEERKEIQKQVNELLQKGFIKENLSPYSVVVVLVSKKDGA
ncbi:hypothetical protein CR513_12813, partial [Mucuna pruriens]